MRDLLARAVAAAGDRRAVAGALRGDRRLARALAAADEEAWDWEVGRDRYTLGPRWSKALGLPGGRGTDLDELVRRFVHPDDLPPAAREIAAGLSGLRPGSQREVRVRTAEGERWVLVRGGASERGGDGAVRRLSGTLRDVTELRRLRRQLEAGEGLAVLGRLAAAVAHELNNPLAVVFANLDFAERALAGRVEPAPPADPAGVRAALAEARVAQRRVAGLLRQLEYFAAGGEPRRKPVSVGEEIAAAIALAERELDARLAVESRLADVPDVQAAPGQLAQVVAHLLVHAAASASPDRAGPAAVRVSTRLDEAGRVEVEVRGRGASGPGAAFDWFARRGRGDLSAGLGLAIGRAVIAALGGELEVGEAGGAVTARVLLPREPAA